VIIVAVPRGGGRVAIDATRVDCLLRNDAGELYVYWGVVGAGVFIGPEADWVETEMSGQGSNHLGPLIVWLDKKAAQKPVSPSRPEQT